MSAAGHWAALFFRLWDLPFSFTLSVISGPAASLLRHGWLLQTLYWGGLAVSCLLAVFLWFGPLLRRVRPAKPVSSSLTVLHSRIRQVWGIEKVLMESNSVRLGFSSNLESLRARSFDEFMDTLPCWLVTSLAMADQPKLQPFFTSQRLRNETKSLSMHWSSWLKAPVMTLPESPPTPTPSCWSPYIILRGSKGKGMMGTKAQVLYYIISYYITQLDPTCFRRLVGIAYS